MGVTYSVPLTDDHVVESYAQHRAQQKALLWLAWPLKALCAAGLLGLLAVGVFAEVYVLIGVSAFFLLLLAVGPRFDYWWTRRRWRRHPQFNELLRIEVTDSDISFATAKSSATVQWSAFAKAVARPRGVLLYSSSWEYYWLPDEAITVGTSSEIRDTLRTKLPVQDAG
jgi:hypothetical protein